MFTAPFSLPLFWSSLFQEYHYDCVLGQREAKKLRHKKGEMAPKEKPAKKGYDLSGRRPGPNNLKHNYAIDDTETMGEIRDYFMKMAQSSQATAKLHWYAMRLFIGWIVKTGLLQEMQGDDPSEPERISPISVLSNEDVLKAYFVHLEEETMIRCIFIVSLPLLFGNRFVIPCFSTFFFSLYLSKPLEDKTCRGRGFTPASVTMVPRSLSVLMEILLPKCLERPNKTRNEQASCLSLCGVLGSGPLKAKALMTRLQTYWTPSLLKTLLPRTKSGTSRFKTSRRELPSPRQKLQRMRSPTCKGLSPSKLP